MIDQSVWKVGAKYSILRDGGWVGVLVYESPGLELK